MSTLSAAIAGAANVAEAATAAPPTARFFYKITTFSQISFFNH